MREARVGIDPGHGGRDNGHTYIPLVKKGASYYEKDIALAIGLHLAAYMCGYHGDDIGYKVLLTRGSNKTVSKHRRILEANLAQLDAFVSCHVNDVGISSDPDKSQGVSVSYFHTSDEGFNLADSVLAEILKTGLLKPYEGGLEPSGVDILRKANMPAIIVKTGFIRNYTDLAVITDEDNQAKIAYAIFRGVHYWLS